MDRISRGKKKSTDERNAEKENNSALKMILALRAFFLF